jgi:HK97 family phage major capsid protein
MDVKALVEQVKRLEAEYTKAVSKIEELTKANADLTTATEELKTSKAELEKAKADLEKQTSNFIAGQGGQKMSVSDETKLLGKFGCSHVKDLIGKNVAHPQYGHISASEKMAVMELKKSIDIARWCAQMFYGAPRDRDNDLTPPAVKNILDTRFAREHDLAARLKAFGTDVSGSGAEWIMTAVSQQYIEEYELERKVASLFREIPMPTNPFKLPVVKANTVARIIGEGAQATANNFGTDSLTFDAANKLHEYYVLPEELNEDSAPAILEIGRAQLMEAIDRAMETALLNGDLSGTHMDSDVTASSDARKLWKGLRKRALANSANGSVETFSSAITTAKLDAMLARAGKFGINPRECVFIVSPQGYNQMVSLPEVTTVEKFGQQATILTGALAAFRARPIIVSEFVREDLNASGVYDATTVNNTCVFLVNKTRFLLGRRRPVRILAKADDRVEYDRWTLGGYARYDFQGHEQNAQEKSVILGVDVTV